MVEKQRAKGSDNRAYSGSQGPINDESSEEMMASGASGSQPGGFSAKAKNIDPRDSDDGDSASFMPQWGLLVRNKESKDESGKSRSTDEGDRGSTRQKKRVKDHKRVSEEAGVKKLSEKQIVRQKRNWIKVTFNRVTKRITNVPTDLETL